MHPSDPAITEILADVAAGDRAAVADLLPHVYGELHQLAQGFFRDQRPGHTLQPTALVHEAFVKLSDRDDLRAHSRGQFFALAAKVMRHILVDHARGKQAAKRGGDRDRVTLSGATPAGHVSDQNGTDHRIDVLALEDALGRLAALSPDDAQLVELRFFGGLTSEQAAAVIGISRTEIARRWRRTRAWLADELDESGA